MVDVIAVESRHSTTLFSRIHQTVTGLLAALRFGIHHVLPNDYNEQCANIVTGEEEIFIPEFTNGYSRTRYGANVIITRTHNFPPLMRKEKYILNDSLTRLLIGCTFPDRLLERRQAKLTEISELYDRPGSAQHVAAQHGVACLSRQSRLHRNSVIELVVQTALTCAE